MHHTSSQKMPGYFSLCDIKTSESGYCQSELPIVMFPFNFLSNGLLSIDDHWSLSRRRLENDAL